MKVSTDAIRVVVLDVDGVMSEGEGRPLDLAFLGLLAQMNREARRGQDQPAVTVCTGRPAPYVEVILQAIDGYLPGIYESGAGLYIPDTYRFEPHPSLVGRGTMGEAHRRLQAQLVDTGKAYFQPGKDFSLSLFPTHPEDIGDLETMTLDALGPLADDVSLVSAISCLNILPLNIDKGVGLRRLAEHIGISPKMMIGVGDSDGDLPFLRLVDCSGAPSNAVDKVKRAVGYVSPHPTGRGVIDILRHYGVSP